MIQKITKIFPIVLVATGLSLGGAVVASAKGSASSSVHWSRQNIQKVQEKLSDEGYYHGKIDGVMGPQTDSAIRQYQKAQGLPVTGHLDSQTGKRLGVWPNSGKGSLKQAGSSVKSGGEDFEHEITKGKPVAAGKDLGKSIGHAGKEVGKGVKKAVTHP